MTGESSLQTVILGFMVLNTARSRTLAQNDTRSPWPLYGASMWWLAILACVLLASNAIGAVPPTGPSFYLAALLLLLALVALQLLSLLAVIRTKSQQ